MDYSTWLNILKFWNYFVCKTEGWIKKWLLIGTWLLLKIILSIEKRVFRWSPLGIKWANASEYRCQSPRWGILGDLLHQTFCVDFSWTAEFHLECFPREEPMRTIFLEFCIFSNVWDEYKCLGLHLLPAGFWGLTGSPVFQLNTGVGMCQPSHILFLYVTWFVFMSVQSILSSNFEVQ